MSGWRNHFADGRTRWVCFRVEETPLFANGGISLCVEWSRTQSIENTSLMLYYCCCDAGLKSLVIFTPRPILLRWSNQIGKDGREKSQVCNGSEMHTEFIWGSLKYAIWVLGMSRLWRQPDTKTDFKEKGWKAWTMFMLIGVVKICVIF